MSLEGQRQPAILPTIRVGVASLGGRRVRSVAKLIIAKLRDVREDAEVKLFLSARALFHLLRNR